MAASRVRKAGKGDTLPRTEQDIPIGIVGLIVLICMLPIAWLLGHFSIVSGLGSHTALLVIGGVLFVLILSFLVSTVCGYMAGLIGSSNSPLSGIGILVVIIAALLLVAGVKSDLPADSGKALVAFALFITSVVFAVGRHCQQQPAGSQDWPVGGRHAVAAAGGAGDWRDCGRRGHPSSVGSAQ